RAAAALVCLRACFRPSSLPTRARHASSLPDAGDRRSGFAGNDLLPRTLAYPLSSSSIRLDPALSAEYSERMPADASLISGHLSRQGMALARAPAISSGV